MNKMTWMAKHISTLRWIALIWIALIPPAHAQPLVILTTFSEKPVSALVADFNRQHPDIDVNIVYRRTEPAIRLMNNSSLFDVDLVLSSSAPFFNTLREKSLLRKPETLTRQLPQWLEPHTLDLGDDVVTIAYSGLGIMYKTDYLERYQLPVPSRWEDLADPVFFRHIMMSTPTQSGTTHVMVESILENYGWEQGWALLMKIGGNLASLAARSFGVSDGIARGLVGAGPVIDNYAFNSQKYFNNVGFSYLQNTALLPTYIGLTKSGKSRHASEAFIRYLLSESGQQVLDDGDMEKVPLNQPALAQKTTFTLNSETLYRRQELVKALFDTVITDHLPLLNDAWQAIYSAEARGVDSDVINEAKRLASTVPVTAEMASDPTILKLFQSEDRRRRLPSGGLTLLLEWQEQVDINLKQAIALAGNATAQED